MKVSCRGRNNRIAAPYSHITVLRGDQRTHPEFGFKERRTAGIVAEKLGGSVNEVLTELAATTVIGVVQGRQADSMIGLRVDMDALPMQEPMLEPVQDSMQ